VKTRHKIALARVAYHLVMLGRHAIGKTAELVAVRRGLRWRLDLREGIDLSIYLLGAFEVQTLRTYEKIVRSGDVVLDIGANIGAHTLHFARLVGPAGRVVAFEPTRYAFEKLEANLGLNPTLASRVQLLQAMLAASSGSGVTPPLYSSWPTAGETGDVHERHRGRLMETTGAGICTLDDVVEKLGLTRVDFVKLDVDGHEHGVVAGGRETLRRWHPVILMEAAPYLFADRHADFDEIFAILGELGYRLRDAGTGEELPVAGKELRRLIRDGESRNVLAEPARR
jgi:FkbM family methyltransferase